MSIEQILALRVVEAERKVKDLTDKLMFIMELLYSGCDSETILQQIGEKYDR